MSDSTTRTSSQIRNEFLGFFKSKGKEHTIVRSSSLLPDSPNLLFTNAGMNQFVPIFLGQQPCPYQPPRAADTQKCIRAGGKHNDLEDVGLDTYHHTFFEMLGNWSFGDYFKSDAIDWAWELVTGVWGFPKNRLYATVYCPDKSLGDPSDFDQEAYDCWAAKFSSAGLDPKIHIRNGNKKDNFWMMGETGPCGPCSELHFDLTPAGDTQGVLVNQGSPLCIEIWNLVFMQFNANPDGTFSPLPCRNVDTGMGFERVASILQCTKNFTDFTGIISNYETDIFRPIFARLEQLSGKKYTSTLPKAGSTGDTFHEKVDVAFRVIADHIRTLSFAIADGIQPANTDRNYVLRRILRRAIRYGRTLGFHEPFFYQLVDVLADTMGDVFPEIREKQSHVKDVIRVEEEAFNKTLDKGLSIFEQRLKIQDRLDEAAKELYEGNLVHNTLDDLRNMPDVREPALPYLEKIQKRLRRVLFGTNQTMRGSLIDVLVSAGESHILEDWKVCGELHKLVGIIETILKPDIHDNQSAELAFQQFLADAEKRFLELEKTILEARIRVKPGIIPGAFAFLLYDTYGFPLDLTQLLVRERGLAVDIEGFNQLMEAQRARARAAQKKEVISVSQVETTTPTKFVGYDKLETPARVLEVLSIKDKTAVVLDTSACYAEMGGQVGDTGELMGGGNLWRIVTTQKSGNTWLHFIEAGAAQDALPNRGDTVCLSVDVLRRAAIQRHHTVTHLLHWALHEVVSKDAAQKGSFVGPEKLTFDFNCAPLTAAQVSDVEKLVNERIVENAPVHWSEVPFAEIKGHAEVMQFFGEKYGDRVRVVQIGGHPGSFDGYSMELCGGTHTRATGEIGLFRVVSEGAIAAGVRRIEAVAGLCAYQKTRQEAELLGTIAAKINSPAAEVEKKLENLLAQQKELEKQLRAMRQKQAAETARDLAAQAQTIGHFVAIVQNLGEVEGDFLQMVIEALRGQFKGVAVLGGSTNGAVTLVASVSPEFTKQIQAGKIIQAIAPLVGGKGGGKPDFARGGGKDPSRLEEALAKAKSLL